MSKDIHYLGEFNSISDVWELYPNGGGYGDYITIGGQTIYWIEETRSWGPKTDTGGSGTPSETIPHSIDVKGEGKFRDGITVGEYVPETTGGAIDKHGNADLRTAKIESLLVKHDGELIPLSEYIKLFKTELPPDWQEYSKGALTAEMRFLIFDPNEPDKKYYASYKDLKESITGNIFEDSESLRWMDIQKEYDAMQPKDVQIIRVVIRDGFNRDVTSEYRQFDVRRDTGDEPSDAVWSQTNGVNKGSVFQLLFDDLGFREGLMLSRFDVVAYSKSNTAAIVSNHFTLGY